MALGFQTIKRADDGWSVGIIDQTKLPHEFEVTAMQGLDDAVVAIRDMLVRGAPLIGATAAYGMALAMRENGSDAALQNAYDRLMETRPTAVNLRWALDDMMGLLHNRAPMERAELAYERAAEVVSEDEALCDGIGENGLPFIKEIFDRKGQGEPVNILTHCNAGALATCGIGTATAPIYKAQEAGIPVHVWVDETRPRNQGAALTAWELNKSGISHTLIADNTGGHLMQHGLVDICFVGTDRTTADGDVCNKIGTYLKALAAQDNGVPFYVGLPSTTIDWTVRDGISEIPIEKRSDDEVTRITGKTAAGTIETVLISPEGTEAGNYAFDVTPARLVTGLITERGVSDASAAGLRKLFPEQASSAT